MNEKTRFKKIIRIDPIQLEWIAGNKKKAKCKTRAGFLDLIINHYKKYGLPKMRNTNGKKKPQRNNFKDV